MTGELARRDGAATVLGGPTVVIDVGGLRILVDPTFDPPGRRYAFGPGAASRKLVGPACAAADIGRDQLPKGDARDVTVEVKDEQGQQVMMVRVSMEVHRTSPDERGRLASLG